MPRHLLLLVHTVPLDGAFTLNDLAGGGGRMDEVARVLSTALTLSNDLRRDATVTLLFHPKGDGPGRSIVVDGSRVRYLNPDERSTAALLKNALVRSVLADGPVESSPGLTVAPADPREALEAFVRRAGAVWLTESGSPLRAYDGPIGLSAVLSDPTEPTAAERELLEGSGIPRLSVGPRALRSSQVVDLLWNELDLREPPDH
ncbi:MAG: tRNA (pseudouridine(54)-N(1))-methyltransferase TrmY [Thermoplasmata archaeon]|nr:tRNA (pseudouridine(54)-N(1))-methyltransferase TrmY [Thermoplasmata archaeon]